MAYTPDMYPIFYRWLFFIYTYTVLLVLGMAAAIGLTAWLARRTPTPHWLDALLLTLLGAVVCRYQTTLFRLRWPVRAGAGAGQCLWLASVLCGRVWVWS